MLPPITPLSFDSLLEPIPGVNSTVYGNMYIYCTPTRISAHNMGHTDEYIGRQAVAIPIFARVQIRKNVATAVADYQCEAVNTIVAALLLPDSSAFDQTATR